MPVERKPAECFYTDGSITPDEAAEHDFAIRLGRCPNKCGPMYLEDGGQRCPNCKFWCNSLPDREAGH